MVAEITAPISLKNVLGYNFAKVKAGTASVILTSLLSVDENGKTSLDRVYAGGDIVLGAATVILAMGEGRRAAASINQMLAARKY